MEEFDNILIDGELLNKSDDTLNKIQKLIQFEESRLDYFDEIICDKADLKSVILTENMKFIGKTFLYRLSLTPNFFERTNDFGSNDFKVFKYLIVTGIFDAIDIKSNIKRKFYI